MTKYFENIIGEELTVTILTNHLNSGILSHAYLFLGDKGTGKNFLAQNFSRHILCTGCDNQTCESCKNLKNGVHPDYIFLNASQDAKIETVRKAIERVNLSPACSAKKIFFISSADLLSNESGNALLKTIEEPPLDTIIIITATNEKSVPETIVSRCQKIKLSGQSRKSLEKILLKGYSEEDVTEALNYSFENLDEAREFLENEDFKNSKKEIFSDIEIFLNSKSIIEKFKVLEKYDKSKELELAVFFDNLSRAVFVLISSSISGTSILDGIISPNGYNIDNFREMANKILKIKRDLSYNINLKIALEELILESEV